MEFDDPITVMPPDPPLIAARVHGVHRRAGNRGLFEAANTMKAFINTRLLNQTVCDSAAPGGSAVVAFKREKAGTYELAAAHKGKPFVRLPFAVSRERAPRGEEAAPPGAQKQDLRRAVSVELFKLARPEGFGKHSFPLSAGQGMVLRFATELRIQIQLIAPTADRPHAFRP